MNLYEVFYPDVFNEKVKKNRAMKIYAVLTAIKPFINIGIILVTNNLQFPGGKDLNYLTLSNIDNIDDGYYY